MKNLIKRQESSEIQRYFEYVLKKSQSGERFPVDFDKVWPLVYGRKEEAVRALREGGTQDVDYQILRRNAEQNYLNTKEFQNSGGHNRIHYRITVSCMEWLIARKVRPVFEVYRRVFHEAVNKTAEQYVPDWLSEIGNDIGELSVDSRAFYPYIATLEQCGMSLHSGSVSKRRRNYPSEFVRKDGVWWVSLEFAMMFDSARCAEDTRKWAAMRSELLMLERCKQGELPLNF